MGNSNAVLDACAKQFCAEKVFIGDEEFLREIESPNETTTVRDMLEAL